MYKKLVKFYTYKTYFGIYEDNFCRVFENKL